jgi:hypothetical protein
VKKLFLFILTFMYMAVSSGIAMEIHYCMGERAGVDFYKNSNDRCGRCGMKNQDKSGCCSDDHLFLKIDDSHQKAVNNIDFTLQTEMVQVTLPVFDWNLPLRESVAQVNNHAPPDIPTLPARIFHGVFRI